MVKGLEIYLMDGVEMSWLEAYWASLADHIANVSYAGEFLKVPAKQLRIHDESKYSPEEFPYYARQFHGDRGDPQGFARAWLHHQNFNQHHWEYWIMRSDHSKGGSGAVASTLPMPDNYMLEMVADWMGASKSYTGSWDMTDWLHRNFFEMRLHPETRRKVRELLDQIDYGKAFSVQTA